MRGEKGVENQEPDNKEPLGPRGPEARPPSSPGTGTVRSSVPSRPLPSSPSHQSFRATAHSNQRWRPWGRPHLSAPAGMRCSGSHQSGQRGSREWPRASVGAQGGASSAAVLEVPGQAAKCWGSLRCKALLGRPHGHSEKSQRLCCRGREFPAALPPPHSRFRSRRGHLAPRSLLGVGPGCPALFSSRTDPWRRRSARCLLGLVVFRGWRPVALRRHNETRPGGSVPRGVMVPVVLCGKRGNGAGGIASSLRGHGAVACLPLSLG